MTTLLATRAWLRPVSRRNRHFTVGGGRLRQSGPRPETISLRSACTRRLMDFITNEFSSKSWPEQVRRGGGGGGEALEERGGGAFRARYLCDPQWFRDTASRGPTTIVPPESQFRTCPSDHDSIGYPRMSASGESSTTMHRLLHASGSHPIPPPNDPKVFSLITLLATRAWLRPVSRRNRHFTVGGGRLRQSGPRPETCWGNNGVGSGSRLPGRSGK
ncbi:hypothetical protein F511_35934 [Dorcoceras hygrometricum]|uniref:Uncharacterized protein n=1 Tax=Dorcoceras hygrometricum TaxID=472368 RepID=A0A2Z7C0J0_9LAMI|nr:hypothetical protein F511_35934 [Dorcoceras hygrometricum]